MSLCRLGLGLAALMLPACPFFGGGGGAAPRPVSRNCLMMDVPPEGALLALGVAETPPGGGLPVIRSFGGGARYTESGFQGGQHIYLSAVARLDSSAVDGYIEVTGTHQGRQVGNGGTYVEACPAGQVYVVEDFQMFVPDPDSFNPVDLNARLLEGDDLTPVAVATDTVSINP